MSYKPFLSPETLKGLNKVLFVTHLALGDYTYLKPYFKALKQKYPELKIDILVDDVRRTRLFWKWDSLRRNTVTEWVEEEDHFNRVYKKTHTWSFFKNTLKEARVERYTVVVALTVIRTHKYAKWAREISPRGFVVGVKNRKRDLSNYLDVQLPLRLEGSNWHTIDLYGEWFKKVFGLELTPEEVKPKLEIPTKWIGYGAKFLHECGLSEGSNFKQAIFINPFAKNRKRCWTLGKTKELVKSLIDSDKYKDALFILNAPPSEFENTKKYFADLKDRVFLLEAKDNFFQLPSVIKMCDLVITVETSIMHFAVAMEIPVISLMRNKNPEWVPYGQGNDTIIFAPDRNSWVKEIAVNDVLRLI